MKEKKQKKQSLKAMQQELLDIVKNKYYDYDTQIQECVNRINSKYEEMRIKAEQRKIEKEKLGDKVKKVLTLLSFKTLQLCDKLIIKEQVSNQIMEYPENPDLKIAEKEIKEGLEQWTK